MNRTQIVAVTVAAGIVLLVVLSIAAFVVLPVVWRGMASSRSVSATLVYEVEEQDAPVDMNTLVAAVDRRVNPEGRLRGRVRRRGHRQIEIDVYSGDPADIRRIDWLATSLGTLEFRILANPSDDQSIIEKAEGQEGDEIRDDAGQPLAWWVPVAEGQENGFRSPGMTTRKVERDGAKRLEVLVVNDRFNVNGGYFTRVTAAVDQSGRPCISFQFIRQGGMLFRGLTSNNLPDQANNVYRNLGIILNGEVYTAPRIITAIGENGQITGDFTRQEVEDLVDVLNAGTLPARLKKVEDAEAPEKPGSAAD